jgi:hypothetical protein
LGRDAQFEFNNLIRGAHGAVRGALREEHINPRAIDISFRYSREAIVVTPRTLVADLTGLGNPPVIGYAEATSSLPGTPVVNLFDGLSNSFWETFSPDRPPAIDVRFHEPKSVTGYRMTVDPTEETSWMRQPQAFRLSGSNDDTNWTVLDERKGIEDWKMGDVRTFDVTRRGTFQMFRLELLKPGVQDGLYRLYELELLDAEPVVR